MREIKFRAWVKSPGIMREVLGIHYNQKDLWLRYGKDKNIMSNIEEAILMQYTGVNDINGIEIYEGDIVEYFNSYLGVIRYVKGSFIVDGQYGYDILCELGGKISIAGNIFENRNLLDEVED